MTSREPFGASNKIRNIEREYTGRLELTLVYTSPSIYSQI